MSQSNNGTTSSSSTNTTSTQNHPETFLCFDTEEAAHAYTAKFPEQEFSIIRAHEVNSEPITQTEARCKRAEEEVNKREVGEDQRFKHKEEGSRGTFGDLARLLVEYHQARCHFQDLYTKGRTPTIEEVTEASRALLRFTRDSLWDREGFEPCVDEEKIVDGTKG